MGAEIVRLNIDWAEAYGWKCPFCGGEIDHLDEDRDHQAGYAEDSYTCQTKGGDLCESAYFVVRWSLIRKGDNGDALTLARWIEIEVDERYQVNPDKASAKEAQLAWERREKQFQDRFNAALELIEDARESLDTEGVLSDEFKVEHRRLKDLAGEK